MVGRLIDETLDAQYRERSYAVPQRNSRSDIEQEVKVLYARGEIDDQVYARLLRMARTGDLDRSDLNRLRDGVQPEIPPPQASAARRRDKEIVSGLNRLYAHRSRLESSRAETEQMLESLEADRDRLQEQARTAAERAELAMPDQARARAYLKVKGEAQERLESLQARVTSLQESLRRIDSLRDELAIREAELKALESTEKLAGLEAEIRSELLKQ